MGHALHVTDLHKTYPADGEVVHALAGVSLTIRTGQLVAIMGASGSGKSTLLHLIGALDQPTSGSIIIDGEDIGAMDDRRRTLFRRRRLGIIFQAYNLLPTLTALENVTLPAMLEGIDSRRAESRGRELLELVDLGHRMAHRPQAMSGGEQQRVAIARSMMNDPTIILADEPTGNLDTQHGEAIWRLMSSLTREDGRTIITVTHEPAGAAFADRIVILKDGRIVGEMEPGKQAHASHVAARYAELVG